MSFKNVTVIKKTKETLKISCNTLSQTGSYTRGKKATKIILDQIIKVEYEQEITVLYRCKITEVDNYTIVIPESINTLRVFRD